ncbi:MAG: hypothetical protein WCS65_12585 [Verrucomicrobiae bacterium]
MISPLPLPPKVSAGQPIRAEHWNAALDAAQSLRVQLSVADPVGSPSHPWKVSVSQTDGETLRIDVRAGCINDTAATIAWKVKEDPRGEVPESSREAQAAARLADKEYFDRPLHEEDPPFLTLPLACDASQWTASVRPPIALRESASKGAKFYVAAVVLAAFPFNILMSRPLPKRFRVYAGRANPSAIRQARVGELLQLAQIWQVRSTGGDLETVSATQKVFWNLGCMAVEPSLQRVGEVETPLVGLPLADMWSIQNTAASNALVSAANDAIAMLESDLSSTEFWTT